MFGKKNPGKLPLLARRDKGTKKNYLLRYECPSGKCLSRTPFGKDHRCPK